MLFLLYHVLSTCNMIYVYTFVKRNKLQCIYSGVYTVRICHLSNKIILLCQCNIDQSVASILCDCITLVQQHNKITLLI